MNRLNTKKIKIFKKSLAILLVILVVLSSIKFLFLKPKNVFADSTLGFNEGYGTSVNDNNGNVTAGTITNAVWKQEDLCKIGKCLYFDGAGDYVSFADDTDIDFTATNTFTLTGWFRHPEISTNPDYLIAKHQSATAGGYKVYMDSDGDIAFGIDDDGTWGPEDIIGDDQNKNFDDNKWHHFSAVKNGTTGTYLYVDGNLIDEDTSLTANGSLVNAASLYIGIDADGSSNGWSGFIDEVKILRSARTAAEIKTDYLGSSPSTSGSGPVGHWKLDEASGDAIDSSGNGTTLTDSNTVARVAGKYGNAGDFELDNTEYLSAADNTALSITGSLTLSAWIKPESTPSVNYNLVGKWDGANESYRLVMPGTDEIRLELDSGGNYIQTTASNLVTGTWYHVLGVYDSTSATAKIYINGSEATVAITGTIPSSIGDDAGKIHIGAEDSTGGAARPFDGLIDDVKVYNYARSQIQIREDMMENPPSGISASFGPDQSYISNGLVGYWKMDENTGTSTTDASGNGNNSTTWTGATWAAGKFGTATSYNGSDQVIRVAETTSTDLGATNDSYSVNAWINFTSCANTCDIVDKMSNSSTAYPFNLYIDSTNMPYFSVRDSSGNVSTAFLNSALTAGVWYHISAVRDVANDKLYLYVNGTTTLSSQTATDISTTSMVNNDDLSIGNGGGSYTNNDFNGKIDDIRIYNRALSPVEVQKLYNFTAGPVGYWNFDENTGTTTAYDKSGNGSNATFGDGSSESPITYSPWSQGKFGSAVRFTGGDNGLVAVVGTPAVLSELPHLSISAWIRNTQATLSSNDRILDHQTSNTAGWNFLLTTQERLRFIVDYDGASDLVVDSPVISTLQNTWHHVAVSWDGTSNSSGVHLYIDGVEATPYANVTSGVGNRVAETVNSSLGIGRLVNSNQSSFNGIIDDVKLYNYPRTQSQLIEDMNGGHPAPGSPIGSSVAYWKFDEGFGTTAYDNSINSNSLTLSTASWTNSGKFGKAFNGLTNVRLSRTDDADLDLASADDATFSVWFKSDSATNPSANEYLLEKGGNIATDAIGYAIYTSSASDGLICFGIDDDATSFPEDETCTASDLYDNTWHHIVATKTGTSRLDLYVDGKPNGTPDTSISSTGTLENSATFYIGDSNATDGSDEFLGDIDEVKIFRSALNSDAIKVLYNQSAGQTLGALSTDSSNNPSNSDTDSYCPPGQGSACTGPVAEWKLDENTGTAANDSSGNGLVGTLTNSPTWVTGKIGQAVKFNDALNQYISVASSSSLGFTTPFTISAWANTSLASTTQLIISKDGAGTALDNRGYYLRFNSSGKINGALYNNSGTACDASPSIVTNTSVTTWATNTWYYITMVYDGSNIKLYINGILEDTDATSGTSCAATDNFEIGSFNGGSNNLTGLVDNVVAYNYARTPAQIVWDMNHGAPVGWWKLDENTGTAANNSAGNSTAGTLTNTPTWVTGKFNTGVTFAGSNQQILITDDSDFDFADDESMSVTGWFNHTTASAQEIILSKYAAAGYKVISESDGDITCGLDYDSTWSPTDSATSTLATYDDNSWHHFACVKDGATSLSLYIDGALITTDSSITATNTLTNADPLYLGIDADGTSNDYTGTLDDIRIYRYPLTAQQIKTIMNNGAAVKY